MFYLFTTVLLIAMSLSKFTSFKLIASIGSFAFASTIFSTWIDITPANAFGVTFDNSGFEDLTEYNHWSTTGDASIQNNTFQVNPVQGSSQALITTGRSSIVDDPNTSAGTFNFSGSNPVTATSDSNAAALQDFLDISPGSLSIFRSGSADNTKFRTAKEGSAIFQDIEVTFTQEDINLGNNIFAIDFNWAHLSNDGLVDSRLGEQDFSFFTVYDISSAVDDRTINLLGSSGGSVDVPHTSGGDFQDVNTAQYDVNNSYTYVSEPVTDTLTHTYRVGFGVVDVDGLDRTSGLLLDNLNARQVPFDFSPSAGIGVVLSMIGLNFLKRKCSSFSK